MPRYTISFSNIAGIQNVQRPDGETLQCIYLSEDRQPEAFQPGSMRRGQKNWEELPLSIRAAVNRNFGTVFALPVMQRENFVRNFQPQVIDVEPEVSSDLRDEADAAPPNNDLRP